MSLRHLEHSPYATDLFANSNLHAMWTKDDAIGLETPKETAAFAAIYFKLKRKVVRQLTDDNTLIITLRNTKNARRAAQMIEEEIRRSDEESRRIARAE